MSSIDAVAVLLLVALGGALLWESSLPLVLLLLVVVVIHKVGVRECRASFTDERTLYGCVEVEEELQSTALL